MVKYGMSLLNGTTNKQNPSQFPVIVMDQPLYALTKQIQWNWPTSEFGEKQYVLLGDFMEDSGWSSLLDEAEIWELWCR